MSVTTIMIVDDHTLLRETWAKILSFHEHLKIIANTGNGQEAIQIAKEKNPALVLLDINMAPLNGFDILQAIRKYSPISKVIAVSMHSQPSYAKKMLRSGARAYVTKNSTSDELMTAVEQVIAGRKYLCSEIKNILAMQMTEEEEQNAMNSLTQKHMEVIRLMKMGLASKEIAMELNITTRTVQVHKQTIYKKMKVRNSLSLLNLINQHEL
ncbi:MAG TPA: response regulator transcription factor [Puia sp.]|jgi:two-component system invasion response regulator UvrY|nr:response regulator transcription factor [Puia sp.]